VACRLSDRASIDRPKNHPESANNTTDPGLLLDSFGKQGDP
jgi:hypothetical protein